MDVYAETVKSAIQERSCSLNALGKFVFENPELQFEEHKAHDFITNYLEQEGFLVQRNYILETAFRAEYGRKQFFPYLLKRFEINRHNCGPEITEVFRSQHLRHEGVLRVLHALRVPYALRMRHLYAK